MTATLYQIWAAIGPLAGVVIGAWLSARWQRKRWIQDNKVAEYRQVLDVLETYRWRSVKHLASSGGDSQRVDPSLDRERRMQLADAEVSLANCLADRLFIRDGLAKTGIKEGLREFERVSLSEPGSISRTIKLFGDLQERVVRAAEGDLKLK